LEQNKDGNLINVFYGKPFIDQVVKVLETLIYKEMKATGRINKQVKTIQSGIKVTPGYYFHADEDFREDWDWGKKKVAVAKAISKPASKV
jgi:hypothetical protein